MEMTGPPTSHDVNVCLSCNYRSRDVREVQRCGVPNHGDAELWRRGSLPAVLVILRAALLLSSLLKLYIASCAYVYSALKNVFDVPYICGSGVIFCMMNYGHDLLPDVYITILDRPMQPESHTMSFWWPIWTCLVSGFGVFFCSVFVCLLVCLFFFLVLYFVFFSLFCFV